MKLITEDDEQDIHFPSAWPRSCMDMAKHHVDEAENQEDLDPAEAPIMHADSWPVGRLAELYCNLHGVSRMRTRVAINQIAVLAVPCASSEIQVRPRELVEAECH